MDAESEEKRENRKRTYTIYEIQEILGISRSMTYRLVHTGAFRVVKIGHTLRVPKKSFDEWLDGQETEDEDIDTQVSKESSRDSSQAADLSDSDSEVSQEKRDADEVSDTISLLKMMQDPETRQVLKKVVEMCSR